MESLLSINLVSVILICFTYYLVISDRAFSRKRRIEFYLALIACLIISILSQHYKFGNFVYGSLAEHIIISAESLLRPFIVLMLILVSSSFKTGTNRLIAMTAIVNILFVAIGFRYGSVALFVIYFIILIASLIMGLKHDDKSDLLFAVSNVGILVAAFMSEHFTKDMTVVDTALGIIVCLFYYYFVMRTYKKDGLTGLLIRHNLNYEMSDLLSYDYDLVLIDVDNFKLINDKYGHDKGDEVLVTITDTVKKNLPKGCRMYRFGGDEFVIISRKVSAEELTEALAKANSSLAVKDLRVSIGTVHHNAGEDSLVSLNEADKRMYENKKFIKSEDIWDDMTGLYNYRGFLDELDILRKNAERNKKVICLVGIDVDKLNNINMAYGYTEGNKVITILSKVLKNCLRGSDFIGHLGSDEFVVAVELNNAEDEYINEFVNNIQDNLSSSFDLIDKEYSVKLNIAQYCIDNNLDKESDEFVNNVLYVKQEEKEDRRKNEASNGERDYNDEDEKLVMDILDNNKLDYAFQPIVSAKDGSIVAYEALMRSNTSTMVSPLKILKYAEKNKRSYDIEKFTFFNVLRKVKNANLADNISVFINSIPGYFLSDSDYELLKSENAEWFKRLVVEITEQREIDDVALVTINTRREKDGFNLAIDDYGSGCSNTNSLLRYMPQVVKLDRLLITGIDRNAKKQFFVNSIISFARENDMLILAEGVETESELKMVIRLGVDLIQGYVTAKPSLDIVENINDDVKKIIIEENLKVGSNQRMVYTASSNCELSVVQLAMEDYSKVNVSSEFITFTGSEEYTADMVIRIKDGVNCHMTISNVNLNSVDDEPCITVGENANLVLNIEGNNSINYKGIYVPESSSITLIGAGNLDVSVNGHECYGIGTDTEHSFGKLAINNSGTINLNVDGENCIGIGGGIVGSNSYIEFTAGVLNLNVAGVHAIGVGAMKGDVDMNFEDCQIYVSFRVNSGVVIGTVEGRQNINIHNFVVKITGSGTEVCGIGSIKDTEGKITLNAGNYNTQLNGHIINLIGAKSGDLEIDISHARLDLVGEGDIVAGFGNREEDAKVNVSECSLDLVINASTPIACGAKQKNFEKAGHLNFAHINGEKFDLRN